MAESMDTSEVTIADEDDRKLFVGGLPQVLVFVSLCHLPSTWFSDHPLHQKLFQIKTTFNLCIPGRKARRHLGPLPVFWRARQHKPED